MSKSFLLPLALAASSTGCSLNPSTPEEFAKKIAADMKARGPEQLSGGARIASSEAKGAMLIVEMDRMANRRGDPLTYEQRSRNMQRMACNDFDDFIAIGGTVRMNGRMLSGHRLPPVLVRNCDPAIDPAKAPGTSPA